MLEDMSDDPDRTPDDPKEQLKQGLGLLFRAARGAASSIKKEVDRTDFGKSIDDAGREFVRAASNVVDRLASELHTIAAPKREHDEWRPPEPEHHTGPAPDDEDDEFDGVKAPKRKPKGPTPEDPGFRIAIDDDKKDE